MEEIGTKDDWAPAQRVLILNGVTFLWRRYCGQAQALRPAASNAHFSFARIISSQVTSPPL